MILRLLDNTKTLSALENDISEGLGRLSEATKAVVTEERNGPFTLEFQLPISAKHFADVVNGSIVVAKPNPYESEQMFRVFKISKPLNGIVAFKANHISYDLNKTSVSPFTAVGARDAVVKIASHMTGGDDFTITTTISNSYSKLTNSVPQSARAIFGGQSGSMIDVFGGEWKWDNLRCQLLAERGIDRGVRIAYGKNLTDIRQEENIEAMYTAVMPYVKMSDENDAILGDLQVINSSGDLKILNLDLSSSFDQGEEITKAKINAAAQSYINANSLTTPKVSLTVSFVNLADTSEYKNLALLEQIRLCDTVTVEFEKLGVNTKARVIKTVFDVLAERYTSIEIGNARSSLASTIQQIVDTAEQETKNITSRIEQAVNHATNLITGGLGGYVVIGRNASGEPEEILIMDKPDKSLAVNIVRFNKNGIGFSTNGYNGPYENAWTIDGQLVADFITTGTLDANLIRAGEITDLKGKNYWDLETGEFRLSSTVAIDNGGKTLASIIRDIESDIDGKIETWYQASDPATSWTSAALKIAHTGDLWYKTTDHSTWRYNGSSWVKQTVSDDVFDEIDGKCQVFTTQPVPPYRKGDLWFNSSTSDIMTCITARASGSYVSSDWQKRNKYTDNTAVNTLDNNLNQQGIFNRLTNNGQTQGIYLSNNKLYINASYIQTGTLSADYINGGALTMGGYNDQDGVINMQDSNGNVIGIWDSNGISMTGGELKQTVDSGARWMKISSAKIEGGINEWWGSGSGKIDLTNNSNWDGTTRPMLQIRHDGNIHIDAEYNLVLQCDALYAGGLRGSDGWYGDYLYEHGLLVAE